MFVNVWLGLYEEQIKILLHCRWEQQRDCLRRWDESYPVTLNFCRAFSLMVRPRPGRFSFKSINPSLAFGSPSKMYQNNSLPTSTSTGGKYSAMGAFRLDMTTW